MKRLALLLRQFSALAPHTRFPTWCLLVCSFAVHPVSAQTWTVAKNVDFITALAVDAGGQGWILVRGRKVLRSANAIDWQVAIENMSLANLWADSTTVYAIGSGLAVASDTSAPVLLPNIYLASAMVVGSRVVVGTANGVVMESRDAGQGWDVVNADQLPFSVAHIRHVAFTSNALSYTQRRLDADTTRLFYSTGSEWTMSDFPATSVKVWNDSMYVWTGSKILVSGDGRDWDLMRATPGPLKYGYPWAMLGDRIALSLPEALLVSGDRGRTWHDYSVGIWDLPVLHLAFAPNGELWINSSVLMQKSREPLPIATNTGVATDELPASAKLLSAVYPNPANSTVTIGMAGSARRITVTVHDVLGRTVATVFDGIVASGKVLVAWDATDLNPGTYLIRAVAGKATDTSVLFVTH
ncbi:MAG: hypothetical protein ACI80V_002486 [Rhodothermales bacterium]|jgi:hypothetical protein